MTLEERAGEIAEFLDITQSTALDCMK
ncbi:hypothetical protein LCGC14_3106070, partial [marine sediment metagenome]